MNDSQSRKQLRQDIIATLITIFWITYCTGCICILLAIYPVSSKMEIHILVFGYLAYGLQFVIDCVDKSEVEAIYDKWLSFFLISITSLVTMVIYPAVIQAVFEVCMSGRTTPFPDCARPQGMFLVRLILPFSLTPIPFESRGLKWLIYVFLACSFSLFILNLQNG